MVVTRLDQDVSGKALSEDNQLFHSILYSRCGNAFLLELISNLHRNIERYMRRYLVDHIHNDRSQETHRKILEAVRRQDTKQAKQYLEAHMRTAKWTASHRGAAEKPGRLKTPWADTADLK